MPDQRDRMEDQSAPPPWRRWLPWLPPSVLPSVLPSALLSVLLWGVVAALKIRMVGTHGHMGWDAAVYFDVAKNLAEGRGLTIDVSLYHQAYPSFPHPTSLYPLWPAVLALGLTVLPLQVAATWFPTALFFVAMALAFVWGRRLQPAGTLPLGVHGGHVILAVMGLQPDLLRVCGIPNTEALAFLLTFASLVRAPALFARLGIRDGVELGLWCVALFLTRTQAVTSALALLAALPVLLLLIRDRKQVAVFTASAVAAFVVVFAPYWLWVGTFLDDPPIYTYFEFAQARVPSALPPIQLAAHREGWSALARSILHGFDLAFFDEERGYRSTFGFFFGALPLALLALPAVAVQRRHQLRDDVRAGLLALAEPSRRGLVWMIICAMGAFALIHVTEQKNDRWWFNERHGAAAGLMFFWAFVLLFRLSRWTRWLGVALFFAASIHLAKADAEKVADMTPKPAFATYNERLAQWLQHAQQREGRPLVVAMTVQEARLMAWRVPAVGYHAVYGGKLDNLLIMCRDLNVRYVILRDGPGAWGRDQRFEASFRLVDKVRGSKRTFFIYEPLAERPEPSASPTESALDSAEVD